MQVKETVKSSMPSEYVKILSCHVNPQDSTCRKVLSAKDFLLRSSIALSTSPSNRRIGDFVLKFLVGNLIAPRKNSYKIFNKRKNND